jgi:hypothetical protein
MGRDKDGRREQKRDGEEREGEREMQRSNSSCATVQIENWMEK